MNFEALEARLGYVFRDKRLLEAALTHPSYFREKDENGSLYTHYQRLEFLGDAVLGCVLAHYLFVLYPKKREGFLSRAQSVLSRGSFLVSMAKKLDLIEALATGGRLERLPESILEDTVEALIGALFLDSDFSTTYRCVIDWVGNSKTRLHYWLNKDNPKGKLQEYLVEKAHLLEYRLVGTKGPTHSRSFEIELYLENDLLGKGVGPSKKKAEAQAASFALKKLKKN